MDCLLDTSVLVRLANTNDPQRGFGFDSIAVLHRRSHRLWIAPQNLLEFWNVATRPTAMNGLGQSTSEAGELVIFFEEEFALATEHPQLIKAVLELALAAEVIGKQIHDARLVAICHQCNIPAILTFNVRHFARFASIPPGLEVLDPVIVARGQ